MTILKKPKEEINYFKGTVPMLLKMALIYFFNHLTIQPLKIVMKIILKFK